MSDLISRQYVLDKFKALCDACGVGEKYEGVMCRCCYLDDGICIVEDAPSAEPERKKGKWIYDTERVMGDGWTYSQYHCSECKYQQIGGAVNFCPNCGADMRGDR